MSSSNNVYNADGNYNNGVYPLSLYLSSLSGHQAIIRNPYNHELTASPAQMVSAVPDSVADYTVFNSNNSVIQQGFEFPEVTKEIKKAVKKDRHSKIHTAQGLRDRRVRLSIGIARQFFDLQDMLGFDKASKTLDWLLRKSKEAIKEVVQAKKLNNDDEDFGNGGGYVEEKEDEEDEDGSNSFVNGSIPESFEKELMSEVKKAEKKKKKSGLSNISSKGSIGKGKERTREMNPEAVSDIMDPFKRSIIFNEGEDMTRSFYKEAIEEFDNEESILAKMKMDQSYNQHNGTFMSVDQISSSNYNTILPQVFDYDQNLFAEDQTFCSVTDTNFSRGFL